MKKPLKKEVSDKLNIDSERLTKKKPSGRSTILSESDPLSLLHNLQVYQIELQSQNEELLLAKENYELLIQKYIELYDSAPAGYFTISREGKILDLNLSGSMMLGKDRLQLKNSNFESFVLENSKSIFNHFLNKIFTDFGKESCDVIVSKDDLTKVYYNLTGNRTAKGEHCLMTMIDITERMKNELELRLHGEIIENMSEGVHLVTAADELIVFSNSKFDRMLGYEPGDLIGKHVSILNASGEKSAKETAQPIIQSLNEIGSWKGEVLNVKKDGSLCWGYANVSKFDHPQFGPVWVSIHHDITEKKKAEEALRKSEENFKSFVQHSPDIIYKFSSKRGGLFWSDKVKEILGFSSEEICENPFLWSNSIHPDDQLLVKNAIEADLNGTNYNIDYRIKTKDGNWVWLHDYFMDKIILDDEVIIEGHATDITQQKKLEDSLRILSYAVDQSPVSIVITDTNGNIEYVNPKFTQVTGYSLIEAYEKNPRILKTGYTSKEEYSNLWKTIRSGNEWIGEFCNKKKNGELYWETAVISPIINEKGEITHFVAVKEDITNQKETERRIQSSIIEAEERERMHFSQELHDGIGPLLSATKMYVQWLAMPDAKIEQSEIIKDIEKFLDESSRTIREISFKLSPHILQNFGLIEAIRTYTNKVKETSALVINLKAENIARFEMNSEAIAYRVLCECINNTLKHAKASEISINIFSKNNLLLVEYSDNGIGFDLDTALSGHKGIGLLSMQNRLKSINGQLGILSAPGKGMSVKFQFKLTKK